MWLPNLSGGAAPGENSPSCGGPWRGQQRPAPWPGQGWVIADPPPEPPSRPRSLYLHPVSPVIPGWDSSQPQKSGQVTLHGRCRPSCGLHPRPSRLFLGAPPGPPAPSLQALVQMPSREAFPSVCLVDSPHLQGPCVARCAEPSLRRV